MAGKNPEEGLRPLDGWTEVATKGKADGLSKDAQAHKQKIRFLVPRNDPFDTYKQNSEEAVKVLAHTPVKEALDEVNEAILQKVAMDMDHCLPTDDFEIKEPRPIISEQSDVQLKRLPTWLRSMIEHRYNVIHEYFGHQTHEFLSMVANAIDLEYRSQYLDSIGAAIESQEKQRANMIFHEDSILSEHTSTEVFEDPIAAAEFYPNTGEVSTKTNMNIPWRTAQAVGRWKALLAAENSWKPHLVQRAENALRTAMITQAAASDLAIVEDDEDINLPDSDASGNEDEEGNDDHWLENKKLKEEFLSKARAKVDIEFKRKPLDNVTAEQLEQIKLEEARMKQKQMKLRAKVTCFSYIKHHPLYQSIQKRRIRKKELIERGLFRRYSRIWHKGCGNPIQSTKLMAQNFRWDENFHSYVETLVTWKIYRLVIMVIILSNACLLAAETDQEMSDIYDRYFNFLDNFFLSVYTMEFTVKVYAQPRRYWKSGFNVFDSIILAVSLIKSLAQWLDILDTAFLQVLLILRSLRILRGVSFSIQLQVLVTALVETIRTHVLSVVVLLGLLMYIAAIVSFYLFAHYEALRGSWGFVPFGILRMFGYVTMDGWTEIKDEFKDADLEVEGTIFSLVCIVLGNFLFSNIFIAIIIMNISEATDSFRERQVDDRFELVERKKDLVFRRQKLDMRQFLSKQQTTASADFFHMGSQIQRFLRHDDLTGTQELSTSPLWLDCLYKAYNRAHHTANVMMNIHRETADNLLEIFKFYSNTHYTVDPITRGRYNRYMKVKARLAFIKRMILPISIRNKAKLIVKLTE